MKKIICGAACLQLLAGFACAQDINFSSFAGNYNQIPNGFYGMDWNNFWEISSSFVSIFGPSGYLNFNPQPSNVGYNYGGAPASFSSVGLTPFQLASADMTAGWNDNLNLEVQGYLAGNLVYDQNFTLQETTPQDLQFGNVTVYTVDFITSGGTQHPGLNGAGTQFAVADIQVHGVSVPDAGATALLLGLSAGAIGLIRRKLN